MRTFTISRPLRVPEQVVPNVLECKDDVEVWAVAVAFGLTTAVKPVTQQEEEFYKEELMLIERLQKSDGDGEALLEGRWAI